jgi:hypothetical protein
MELVYSLDQLPPRIQTLLMELGQESGFICAVKTAYKPNATIPILWLVVTRTELMLCNTHRTRGLTARHLWKEINEVRKLQNRVNANSIEIIYNDLSKENTVLPLPSGIALPVLENFIIQCITAKGL